MSNIEWKPIKGYEGLYEVSNIGEIKALERLKNCNKGYGKIKEHIMKPNHCKCEYYRVPLTDYNHKRKYYLIHRLVAQAFIPNPNNYGDVNHKDGNKLNNNVDNLEWCTRSDNLIHAYNNGLKPTLKQLCSEIENLKIEVKKIKEQYSYKIGE